MKKILVLFFMCYATCAFGEIITDFSNMCGVSGYRHLYAVPRSFTCASGYFLPANATQCYECPSGYTCAGGTFTFNTTIAQGIVKDSQYFAAGTFAKACAANTVPTHVYRYSVPYTYTCASGYFLPANTTACEPCPTGFSCSGGTYAFNEKQSQGLTFAGQYYTGDVTKACATNFNRVLNGIYTPNVHVCEHGYYLPANTDGCTICPTDNICSGGTYTFNETTDQGIVPCTTPTPYAPTGSTVCYPHILHVDDGLVYLRSTKLTSPSLHIRIEDDVFYANMTPIPTRMNKDSVRYFHSQWDDNHFYICDDTTYPGE